MPSALHARDCEGRSDDLLHVEPFDVHVQLVIHANADVPSVLAVIPVFCVVCTTVR